MIVFLLSITAGAQDYGPYTEIAQGWERKTINNVPSAKLSDLVKKFNQTWPTDFATDAYNVMKQGLAEKILDDNTGYKIIYDAKNGYVEASDEGSDLGHMSACVWRRSNGHSLFAICMGQPTDPDVEIICFYDYNPNTKTLTPVPDILGSWPRKGNGHIEYGLPQKGKELIISEWTNDTFQLYIHHFKWDGMKPVFDYTNHIEDPEEYYQTNHIQVQFKGSSPNISDFVTAILSQEELGECLGAVSDDWSLRQRGQKLPESVQFTVDERNGFIRYDKVYPPLESAYTEFCFWNCSDGKHKLIGTNSGAIMDNKPVETECTGLWFYIYDNQTKTMTSLSPSEVGAIIDANTTVTYALPRSGKNIEATIHNPGKTVKKILKWNGDGFSQ